MSFVATVFGLASLASTAPILPPTLIPAMLPGPVIPPEGTTLMNIPHCDIHWTNDKFCTPAQVKRDAAVTPEMLGKPITTKGNLPGGVPGAYFGQTFIPLCWPSRMGPKPDEYAQAPNCEPESSLQSRDEPAVLPLSPLEKRTRRGDKCYKVFEDGKWVPRCSQVHPEDTSEHVKYAFKDQWDQEFHDPADQKVKREEMGEEVPEVAASQLPADLSAKGSGWRIPKPLHVPVCWRIGDGEWQSRAGFKCPESVGGGW